MQIWQAYLDQVRLLCVPWRHKKSQRRACIDFNMLSITVARLSTSYQREPGPTISGIAHAQLAEGFVPTVLQLITQSALKLCCPAVITKPVPQCNGLAFRSSWPLLGVAPARLCILVYLPP